MSSHHAVDYGVCADCGKRSFESRADAREVAQRLSRADLRPYRCHGNGQAWHLGHLPRPVIAGEISRDQIHLAGPVMTRPAPASVLEAMRRVWNACHRTGRQA